MSKEILLLGEFSTGKSAFINMLLGVSILPERLESTDLPVIKIHSSKPAGLFLREPNQKNLKALDSFQELPKDWSSFEYAELNIPTHPLLSQGLVIWDTPGLNSTNSHHISHLEKFLQNKNGGIKYTYFFLHGNITQTSVNFLKKYKKLREKLVVVVNIKEVKSENECRSIEQQVKRSVRSELGSTSVELLYIGDICEEFNERSNNLRKGLSDWEIIKDWDKRSINFDELRIKYKDRVIGDFLIDEIIEVANQQIPNYKEELEIIEKILTGEDTADIDDEILYTLVNNNYPSAQFLLGIILLGDDSIEVSESDGAKWIHLAAQQGYAKAQYFLGNLYFGGEGTNKDYNKAFEWLTKSAEQGHSDSQFKLGYLYYFGLGTNKDMDKAYHWLKKSEGQFNSDAENFLDSHHFGNEY